MTPNVRKNIVWLASYPKSGNTWLRLFLFNYLFNPDEPAPINDARRIGPGDSSVALYEKLSKGRFDPTDRMAALAMRRDVVAMLSRNGADVNFMKTHNVNAQAHGFQLIPADMTRSALYVLRHPADVALSYAHHFSCSHERAVDSLARTDTVVSADKTVVPQYLGNWSDHVRAWTRTKAFRTLAIRYEDMQTDPTRTFGKVLEFIGAPRDDARLEKAIRFSSFDEAKKQERAHGFVEKPAKSKAFFRSGKMGEGRSTLDPALLARIEHDHAAVMKRYGYLD